MNSLTFDFTGANVLVTGGTSGIGNAIAAEFAKAGASVTVTGTRASADDYPETDLGCVLLPAVPDPRARLRRCAGGLTR